MQGLLFAMWMKLNNSKALLQVTIPPQSVCKLATIAGAYQWIISKQ
jgi:hypothetical protein